MVVIVVTKKSTNNDRKKEKNAQGGEKRGRGRDRDQRREKLLPSIITFLSPIAANFLDVSSTLAAFAVDQ